MNRAKALSILLQLPNVSNNKKRQIREELEKLRMNFPANVKFEIMKHLSGKHKRVYAHVHGLKLPRTPKSPKPVRRFIYNNKKRFNNIPIVYKNPNWKYFLITTRYNTDLNSPPFYNRVNVPIFYNRVNNLPNNFSKLRYDNKLLLPWQPYSIHPRTGKKKYVNYYTPETIIRRSRDPNLWNYMKKRNSNRNTWNAYMKRMNM